jgi:uncharacterized membrane protein
MSEPGGRRRTGLARVFSFRSDDHALMRVDHFFAFVDGVFAIITTLLVLDLKVPEEVEPGELAHALWELAPAFGAFAVGFLQTYAGWVTAHRLSQRLRAIDQWTIIVLGLSLGVVSLVPFSTAVLARSFGDPDNLRTAMQLVTVVGFTSSALFLWGTFHAYRRGLMVRETTDDHIRFGRIVGGASMLGWVASFGASFVAPWAALPMVVWGYAIALLPLRIDEFPVVGGSEMELP